MKKRLYQFKYDNICKKQKNDFKQISFLLSNQFIKNKNIKVDRALIIYFSTNFIMKNFHSANMVFANLIPEFPFVICYI